MIFSSSVLFFIFHSLVICRLLGFLIMWSTDLLILCFFLFSRLLISILDFCIFDFFLLLRFFIIILVFYSFELQTFSSFAFHYSIDGFMVFWLTSLLSFLILVFSSSETPVIWTSSFSGFQFFLSSGFLSSRVVDRMVILCASFLLFLYNFDV